MNIMTKEEKAVLKALLLIPIAFVLFIIWVIGLLLCEGWFVRPVTYYICVTVFDLGLFVGIIGMLFHWRPVRRLSYWAMSLALVAGGIYGAWNWWKVGRFPIISHYYYFGDYMPDNEDNKLVKVTLSPEYLLDSHEGYPRLNGDDKFYCVYAAMAQAMYPRGLLTHFNTEKCTYEYLNCFNDMYTRLIEGECDLVFAFAPTLKEEEKARELGLAFELTPFCWDALVFHVSARNPIDNLTMEQLKGIYSGQITNWQEVGSPINKKIIPYQRNTEDDSQTILENMMGDTPLMEPPMEKQFDSVGFLVYDTAIYRNYDNAIGFSYRKYTKELLQQKKIKLLSIDGIAPTDENIRNGRYPLAATGYIATIRPRIGNIQKIVDFLCSPTGQDLVRQSGYIPVYERKTD